VQNALERDFRALLEIVSTGQLDQSSLEHAHKVKIQVNSPWSFFSG
jgi:hypothetical protein